LPTTLLTGMTGISLHRALASDLPVIWHHRLKIPTLKRTLSQLVNTNPRNFAFCPHKRSSFNYSQV
jgi:hypothetical protein